MDLQGFISSKNRRPRVFDDPRGVGAVADFGEQGCVSSGVAGVFDVAGDSGRGGIAICMSLLDNDYRST